MVGDTHLRVTSPQWSVEVNERDEGEWQRVKIIAHAELPVEVPRSIFNGAAIDCSRAEAIALYNLLGLRLGLNKST